MNDKIIKCKLCEVEMKEFEGNNPQPLLADFEDRVCRDCNDYVTATRLLLRSLDPYEHELVCFYIASVMKTASSLKRSRLKAYKQTGFSAYISGGD
jgi:hypothetical protein|tara:strand:- start:2480 stop:2767 length:288 start_codon:yes stop_codon:yes gene_type:complete